MPVELWTSNDFKKKVMKYEGPDGVGSIRGNIPAALDSHHDYIKKCAWERVISSIVLTQNELTKYRNSAKKTIEDVRKDKSDKKRLKAIDEWEKATNELQNVTANCYKEYERLNVAIREYDTLLLKADTGLRILLETSYRINTDSIRVYLLKYIEPINKKLQELKKNHHPSWGDRLKVSTRLASLAQKDLNEKQIQQALKVIAAALRQLGG